MMTYLHIHNATSPAIRYGWQGMGVGVRKTSEVMRFKKIVENEVFKGKERQLTELFVVIWVVRHDNVAVSLQCAAILQQILKVLHFSSPKMYFVRSSCISVSVSERPSISCSVSDETGILFIPSIMRVRSSSVMSLARLKFLKGFGFNIIFSSVLSGSFMESDKNAITTRFCLWLIPCISPIYGAIGVSCIFCTVVIITMRFDFDSKSTHFYPKRQKKT